MIGDNFAPLSGLSLLKLVINLPSVPNGAPIRTHILKISMDMINVEEFINNRYYRKYQMHRNFEHARMGHQFPCGACRKIINPNATNIVDKITIDCRMDKTIYLFK